MAPTGYLGSTSTSTLSGLEDEKVAEFARAGCARATEHLLSKYRGFVEGKARSYFLAGAEPEDVVQEGMIGLYKAIRDFRSERLAHFRSFAELCVTRQIITAVKSATRQKHALLNDYVSLQRGFGEDDEDGGCLMDIVKDSRIADPERAYIERRTFQQVRAAAREDLSLLEQRVLKGYLEGRTYQEMAGALGRPAKAIDNALQRAKRKVGARLAERN